MKISGITSGGKSCPVGCCGSGGDELGIGQAADDRQSFVVGDGPVARFSHPVGREGDFLGWDKGSLFFCDEKFFQLKHHFTLPGKHVDASWNVGKHAKFDVL